MDKPSPFVIKIPKGATEIDLGPILRPLIFAIEGDDLLDPEKLDRYWHKGMEALAYRRLLPIISRQMVYDYLSNNGWADEEDPPRGYAYIPDYQLKQHRWDRSGPWIRFNGGPKEKLTLPTLDNILRQVSRAMGKPKLEVAKAVIANSNILDRIVNELD